MPKREELGALFLFEARGVRTKNLKDCDPESDLVTDSACTALELYRGGIFVDAYLIVKLITTISPIAANFERGFIPVSFSQILDKTCEFRRLYEVFVIELSSRHYGL